MLVDRSRYYEIASTSKIALPKANVYYKLVYTTYDKL